MSTQQDIIMKKLKDNPGQWFTAKDFQDMNTDHFVGWEASARMSELAKANPGIIESKSVGKFKARRYIEPIQAKPEPERTKQVADQPAMFDSPDQERVWF